MRLDLGSQLKLGGRAQGGLQRGSKHVNSWEGGGGAKVNPFLFSCTPNYLTPCATPYPYCCVDLNRL